VDVMRLTIVDRNGTVSFVAHTSAAVALTAACSHDPETIDDLLTVAQRYDRALPPPGDTARIHQQLASLPPRDTPVFRVLDERTRDASLQPVRAGVVLFNLVGKRIVQIANTDEELSRAGEVNFHNGKFLSRRVFDYQLPPQWSIVP
jgi:hypothetical protein